MRYDMAKAVACCALCLLILTGCTNSTQQPTGAVRVCAEMGGPPSHDLAVCRLLRLSDSGALPRRLSASDADHLIAEIEAFNLRGQTRSTPDITDFNSIDGLTRQLTGLSFENLVSLPAVAK